MIITGSILVYVLGMFLTHRWAHVKTVDHKHEWKKYSWGDRYCANTSFFCDKNTNNEIPLLVMFWFFIFPMMGIVKIWKKGVYRPTKKEKLKAEEEKRKAELEEAIKHLSPEDQKFVREGGMIFPLPIELES